MAAAPASWTVALPHHGPSSRTNASLSSAVATPYRRWVNAGCGTSRKGSARSNVSLIQPGIGSNSSQRSSRSKAAARCAVRNPETLEEAVSQAAGAVQRAVADGKKRQQLQLLLPVDQRQFNYLDTEPRDYPCSIRNEFIACNKMVTAILKELAGLQADTNVEILSREIGENENEQDPVGLLYPSDKSISAVIFPIAEILKKIKSLASSDENRPLLIVNPQWRTSGQVVSDFGFGPWRRQAEEFVDTFAVTYSLVELRIGEASNVISGAGGVVRLLKCYPDNWKVFLMAWDGTSELIGETATRPTYKELEPLVVEARKTIPWQAPPRMLGGSEPAPPPLPKSLTGFLSDEQIEEMDVTAVRRALIALNLPSSGRIAVIKERLKDAQKGANR